MFYRGMEQLVARRAHNPKVVGSSPTPATIHCQMAESASTMPLDAGECKSPALARKGVQVRVLVWQL